MHVLVTKIDFPHPQEPLGTDPTPNRGRNHRQWSFSLFYTKKRRKTWSIRATHRTHPTFNCLIVLHLPKSNTHMYYMSRLFYHDFAMLTQTFSYHLHIIAIIHGIVIYQASLHSCRDRDAGARGGWAGDRWRRYFRCESRQATMHLWYPILDQWSICVLFVHELLYVSLFA